MSEPGGEPKQSFEVAQLPETAENVNASQEQQSPAQESRAGKQATPAALQPMPAMPDVPVVDTVLPVHDDNQIVPVNSPKTSKLPAADKDLIEKQWIEKAKEIVAETKSDPYKQKNEISKAKADYIQKRFKKTVKTDDTVIA